MSLEQNKALVRRFFEEVINAGNRAAAEELLAQDYVERAAPGLAPGREGFKQFSAMISTAFPDIHVTIEDMVAEEDKVVARLAVRGTHNGPFQGIPATGKPAAWTAIHIFRVAGGKLVERWSLADVLGILQQIGAMPAPG